MIGYKAPAFRLKHRIGLQYLAMLLRSPGREHLAIDLVAAVHGRAASARSLVDGAEPYFDAETRRAYGQRLRDLHAALCEAVRRQLREHGRDPLPKEVSNA